VGGWVLSEFCIPRCALVGGFHVSLTSGQGEGGLNLTSHTRAVL
jgi:hypothetical protein